MLGFVITDLLQIGQINKSFGAPPYSSFVLLDLGSMDTWSLARGVNGLGDCKSLPTVLARSGDDSFDLSEDVDT